MLGKWRDAFKRPSGLHSPPVRLQLGAVKARPYRNQTPHPFRRDETSHELTLEVKGSTLPSILDMKVGRRMLLKEHPDDDPMECADNGHEPKVSAPCS
jgi:hypothetical protein